MEEIWKPVVIEKNGVLYDYTGLYEVSNVDGKVRSLNYNGTGQIKVLKPGKNNKGYSQVSLYKNGKMKRFSVHRLVANAFIPNPNNYTEVNHINEDKLDNNVENLEWLPHKKNMQHSQNKKVRCIETKQVFDSVKDALEWAGITGGISACLTGKIKTAGGYSWEYVD